MPPHAAAIIVAGGSSRRMGFDKLLAPLAGKPVLAHTIAAFAACEHISEIIIVGPQSLRPHLAGSTLIPGGKERQDSVQNGLAATTASLIAIHDAARPLVPVEAISRALAAAQEHGAATLSHPISDTLKRADKNGTITSEHISRENLHAMETPQCFQRELIEKAYQKIRQNNLQVTDEVSALQAINHPVHLIQTNAPNPKITYPADIPLAEKLLLPSGGTYSGDRHSATSS